MDSLGGGEGANASLEALQEALQRSHSQPAPAPASPLLMPPPTLPFALSSGAAPLSASTQSSHPQLNLNSLQQHLTGAAGGAQSQSQPALQPDEDYDS